ncbi:MAG TPA: hypothetical protein VMA98_10310 [Candidatus Acidoferrales bacterium]|nr:hypothetical protein [Candidatus Acidoferrales bacterium]
MAKLHTRGGLAELQSAVWVLHASLDPLATLAAWRDAEPAQNGFALRLRSGVRGTPIEAHFRFIPENETVDGLTFAWMHEEGAPLPSMSGTIAAKRFGPLVILSLRAHYACGLEAPERLFFEAVGKKLAEKTFAALQRALVHLLQHAPRAAAPEG